MALQLTVTAQGSLTVTNAYIRIQNIQLHKTYMNIKLEIFKDSIEAEKDLLNRVSCPEFDQETCVYDINGIDNPFTQAYNYLKTQAKFAGYANV